MILLFLPPRLRERLRRNVPAVNLINTILLMLAIFALLAVGYHLFEHQNWLESVWQSWQTETTVGYGNAPAQTPAGRIATIVLGTTGIALLGVLFSRVFSFIEYRSSLRRLGKLKNRARGGYVVFNYPGDLQFATFVNEIRLVEGDVSVCIVDNEMEELPRSIELLGNIHFVRGSSLSKDTFDRAGVHRVKTAIVFPVDRAKPESDASTRMIVELLQDFMPETGRIIYMLVDENNAWLFKKLRATNIPESIEMLALVQECQDRFTAPVIENILMNSVGANPETVEPGPLAGLTWGDLNLRLAELSRRNNLRVQLLALISPGENIDSCPLPSTTIESKHLISLLTYPGELDWPALQEQLRRNV